MSVTPILVLGSGIGGLSAALKLARRAKKLGREVAITLVCKRERLEGATRYAQGGIASVWSKDDSVEEHLQDTLAAGAGLVHQNIAALCVSEGPARVRELVDIGVAFTRAHGENPAEDFDLHREGGHGKHRILHADDLTGLAIERALLAQVEAAPEITILEHHIAIDLVTEGKLFGRWRKPGRCLGAYVLDSRTGDVRAMRAEVTVLATGGAGKVYLYTTNPDTATGDGIAMAHRAGAQVANLEFMQFHPTALYHPEAKNFLITEALRGEGAVLRNSLGEEFMLRHHPQGSLAPRDVVARSIDLEMKRLGSKHVWLDCSPIVTRIGAEQLAARFPNIFETCQRYGMDLTRHPIPVVPAAHYTCGGVRTGEYGETTIPGLYAIGEVACTGLHGANRLASNSLLEAVVFAHRVAEHAWRWVNEQPAAAASASEDAQARARVEALPAWDPGKAVPIEEQIDIAATWLEIRSLMWNYVGIVRSDRRLERARKRLAMLREEIQTYYWSYLVTADLVELRNLLTVAELIVQCAENRKESRGLHYTVDYPALDDEHFQHDTVV